ncbi:hypothetical protein CCAX7_60280 [Capsulimonas corticalis]|uniref:Restriction endonuclease type IV Mrr domain-containing protein n=1 Tax=Capsulimonas corticalis TaxID=2219043 RepID=A0A402CW06_9BACT|nr:restriction endonuclease [Capsulimonas corticalis]BDI33977.1 hypothetical protein CCAX7_60280 [Capsulimonas corticalis]
MSSSSQYDKMVDNYLDIDTTKSGTRYEILTALVSKALYENTKVTHDAKLIGASGAPHQIDVTIETEGRLKRIVIECKDFDVSQGKVGISIVQSFITVANMTKADRAIIVTPVGFTRDAIKLAKYNNIELIVLREFLDTDWGNFIRQIVIEANAWYPEIKSLSYTWPNPQIDPDLDRDLKDNNLSLSQISQDDEIYVYVEDVRFQIIEIVQKHIDGILFDLKSPSPIVIPISIPTNSLQVSGSKKYPLSSLELEVEFRLAVTNTVTKNVDRLAKLLVSQVDADYIVWDDELKKYTIDKDTGEIIPSP